MSNICKYFASGEFTPTPMIIYIIFVSLQNVKHELFLLDTVQYLLKKKKKNCLPAVCLFARTEGKNDPITSAPVRCMSSWR